MINFLALRERLKSINETSFNKKLFPKIAQNKMIRDGHLLTSNKVIDEETGSEIFLKIRRLFQRIGNEKNAKY